jgi:hypothetical protein
MPPTASGLGMKQVLGLYNPFRNGNSLGAFLFAFLAFKTLIGPFPFLDSKLIKYLYLASEDLKPGCWKIQALS